MSSPRGGASAPIVVVGAAGTSPCTVLEQVLDVADLRLTEIAGGPTWVLLRSGTEMRATEYIPGQRRPRQVDLQRLGPTGGDPCGAARPRRRIEIECPDKLLERVWLAGAPEVSDRDTAGFEVALDAVGRAAGVVFVVGDADFERSQLELLRRVGTRTDRLAFVLSVNARGERSRRVAAAIAAKRTVLAATGQALGAASWFVIGDPTPADAAEAGIGDLEALRRRLVIWGESVSAGVDAPAATEPAQDGRVPGERVPRQRRPGALPVPADDQRWREVLDRQVQSRRDAACRRVVSDLAEVLGRCSEVLGAGTSCAPVPPVLDRELHALSARLTWQLESDASEIIREVCGVLLQKPADAAVTVRVRAAVGRAMESSEDALQPYALLLTTTSGIAKVAGWQALDSMAAVGLPTGQGAIFAPIGVAITASCFRRWQQCDERRTDCCMQWLRRAIGGVEAEVVRELDRRFDDLRRGLDLVAADAVDHGFLLV